MPYRAQMGGVFGSGLYPRNPTPDTAGNVIDAVTRGATTLIHGAYLRTMADREQARADAELAIRQREADRQDRHDQWEQQTHQDEVKFRQGQLDRQDALSGYTPASRVQTNEVVPGNVTSNGLLGAPPTATAPTIRSAYQETPASYDVTKSQPYAIEMAKEGERQTARREAVDDREAVHRSNRGFDIAHPLPHGSAGGDSPAVHAATQVRSQINETDQQIKALNAQKKNLAPGTIKGDDQRSAAIDAQIQPLQQRADSLRAVHDRISGKLTDEAGVSRTPAKPAAAPATAIETQDEYDHLHDTLNWPDAKIAKRYTVPKTIKRGK